MKFTTNMFSQILQIIPRPVFSRMVHESRAKRHTKGVASGDQLDFGATAITGIYRDR
jgi:hypothetical protein